MKILVTGAAGFIGFHVSKILLNKGYEAFDLGNINDYYDPNLKLSRLEQLGIDKKESVTFNNSCSSAKQQDSSFVRMNIENRNLLPKLFQKEKFDIVCNLAAQAGVRYSLENPESYLNSNMVGFLNILECCRQHNTKHLVYASSSSVYGLNKKIPFSTQENLDHPNKSLCCNEKE